MRPDLTKRERQVVRLISLGCSMDEAAYLLGVTGSTVESHKTNAMRKLGVGKTALLTRWSIKLGLTTADEKLTRAEKRKLGTGWRDGWN